MIKKKIIKKIIETQKPITIEQYINLCLYSKGGYYINSKVIGKKGDFITAPEISQLFGDILGLFIFYIWEKKINKPINLVELGPGKGTLLIDIINIAKHFTKFKESININLIEKNLNLIKEQKKKLINFNFFYNKTKWLRSFNLPTNKPIIVYANEFLDCLPIRQFYKKDNKWFEKMITFEQDNQCFSFLDVKITDTKILNEIKKYQPKNILEISKIREDYFSKICKHIYHSGGMIIIIDYGYFEIPQYFTLQALCNNKKSNILDNPGSQDITSLVDFKKLIILAKSYKLNIENFSTQREFFLKYGIKERTKKIIEKSTKQQKDNIKKGLKRLIDKNNMGSLFKVLVVSKYNDK